MSSDLPQYIVPERLAKEEVQLEGQIELNKMPRLVKLLTGSPGRVDLELVFHQAENGLIYISGRYDVDLPLTCQRCLEPVTVTLSDTISVGITFEGSTDSLPASVEPLVLTQETMLLADFVEDEILLGLPISPMHELRDCAAKEQVTQRHDAASSPFQVLQKLKSG